MKTQASQFGENFAYVRDNYKGVSESDARELFHICQVEYLPPSKAHIKRLKRRRPLVLKSRPTPPKPQKAAAITKAAAQGRAIAAINSPNIVKANRDAIPAREIVRPHVFSAKHRPLMGPKRESAMKDNAKRNFYVTLGKGRVYSQYRPDLDSACEIFRLFGSWKAYRAACERN